MLNKKILIELQKEKNKANKISRYYHLLAQWLSNNQKGICLADIILERGYSNVAIYGMKELGELLCQELTGSDVKIRYVIDRAKEGIYTEYPLLSPDEELGEVDAIIVTEFFYYDEIKEKLKERVACQIVSLEDLVYEAD